MSRNVLFIAIAWLALSVNPANAQYDLKKGYFQNDKGAECWYTQRVEEESTYFHGTLKARRGIIKFDNPSCMRDSGLGLGVNKMVINNVISSWYSHSDAAFQTREEELYAGSFMQKKGKCIQSRTYPGVGVTIDYVVVNGSITAVYHGLAAQGCTR